MSAPKYHTIIFVPHARARFRKFRVSDRALKFGAAAITASFLLAISSTFGFFAGIRSSSEASRLKDENRRLRESSERYESSIDTLKQRLDAFEIKTRRLAMMAGVQDSRELGRGGTGGPVSGNPNSGFLAGGEPIGQLGDMGGRSNDLARRLDLLEGRFRERQTHLSSTPTITPVAGIPTNGFGSRADPFEGGSQFHAALDISAASGSPVLSPADGIVVRAGWQNGYGKVIEISHGYGFSTLFGHLQSIDIAEGARVERGNPIGKVGSTGRSTGPHLHYEVRVDGRNVNPLEYILDSY